MNARELCVLDLVVMHQVLLEFANISPASSYNVLASVCRTMFGFSPFIGRASFFRQIYTISISPLVPSVE